MSDESKIECIDCHTELKPINDSRCPACDRPYSLDDRASYYQERETFGEEIDIHVLIITLFSYILYVIFPLWLAPIIVFAVPQFIIIGNYFSYKDAKEHKQARIYLALNEMLVIGINAIMFFIRFL